jgi:hypothetical protein
MPFIPRYKIHVWNQGGTGLFDQLMAISLTSVAPFSLCCTSLSQLSRWEQQSITAEGWHAQHAKTTIILHRSKLHPPPSVPPFSPSIFTLDPETQAVITDSMPIIVYGKVADTFGCVCVYIVEGQDRFKTVALTEIAVTVTFTVPLASLMIYVFGIGVPGILAAVLMGYLTSGSVLAAFMLTTDWAKLAKTYQPEESFSSSNPPRSDLKNGR